MAADFDAGYTDGGGHMSEVKAMMYVISEARRISTTGAYPSRITVGPERWKRLLADASERATVQEDAPALVDSIQIGGVTFECGCGLKPEEILIDIGPQQDAVRGVFLDVGFGSENGGAK